MTLVEGPDHPNAQTIKIYLNKASVNKYSTTFDFFTRGYTIVADGAAITARVEGASVSREIHLPDETWMSCIVYFLNNMMKTVITNDCRTKILQALLFEFHSMKKIIEDANRAGWNHLLPEGYRFLQESETRFGTRYQFAQRFLKAAPETYSLLESHLGASARASYSGLKKTSNINGNITGYPAIEAAFDAFVVVVDCNERFEVS